MRRWNGWGDDAITMDLPEDGSILLQSVAGPGCPKTDSPFKSTVASLPESRLPYHPLIRTDPETRFMHSHGQSLPDWIRLRYGSHQNVSDGVAFPESKEALENLVAFASKQKFAIVPYGGGTSVSGQLEITDYTRPALILSLARLNRLIQLDPKSLLATFEAGIRGPDLEAHLFKQGFTLGHYPQSFEYSTLGGWIATRASGQLSSGYGRIDGAFAGAEIVTPRGSLILSPFPAPASGPDLHHMVLGSEGSLGIIEKATVKISHLPERDEIYGVFFPSFDKGVEAIGTIAGARLSLSMVRLSSVSETKMNIALAGHTKAAAFLKRYLPLKGIPDEEGCLCLIGFIGTTRTVKSARREAASILKRANAVPFGKTMGEIWKKNRFLIPYLRNTLWEKGYAVDAIETAIMWRGVTETVQNLETTLENGLARYNERVYVFSHLSNVCPAGAHIYTTVIYRLGEAAEDTMRYWNILREAALSVVKGAGGTIRRTPEAGADNKSCLALEKGPLEIDMIREICASIDPDRIMNPKALF
ncbi:MAG: FAD-binding oxidoreductase [Syntrophales bacterium]|jgi:alkyldihydroxyacetonephosphate synthase|nr:FAD-binding oxidoreductase [Syntrophales bacterium]MDY0043814.1 FAD-binding oxidoreductase [Syntrophales bacterium]